MEFLIDPNVAYLLLVGGVLLGLLAIVQPGTGLLEAGTGLCLLLATYAIYNLQAFNWWALVILALSVPPLVFALRGFQRMLMLGLTILFIIVGSVFLFPGEDGAWIGVNPVLAAIVSITTGGFLWLVTNKTMETFHRKPVHDLGGLIGRQGEARTEIQTEGSVQVDGELWSARSDTPIAAGHPIRVVGREGFILVVESIE